MIYFVNEYSGFGTINFVEKFIEIRHIEKEYIARAKVQRDDRVQLLKVAIEDKYMNDILELISPSLEVESILLMFSSINTTSRVGAAEKYYN